MKRTGYILLPVAALSAACTMDQSDVRPVIQDTVHSAEVWFGTSPSRATYDAELHAEWEESDKVKIVQGRGECTDDNAGILDFEQFADSYSNAVFHGNVRISDSGTQFYHLACPYTARLSVSEDTTEAVFTIPASQTGKWTPYMYASTTSSEKGLSALSASLTPVNGALAIRVYEQCDYSTPKQIKGISIRESNGRDITGVITLTAGYGNALGSPSISEGGSEITSSCTDHTDGENGAYMEYRFNVVPCDAAELEITITDANDDVKTFRTTSALSLEAGKRTGINVTWESPDITIGEISSWYEAVDGRTIVSGSPVYASDGETVLSGSTIYAFDIDWTNVPSSAEKGLVVDGVCHPGSQSVDGISTGTHTVKAYARIDSSKYFESPEYTLSVTPEITATLGTISSWYTESAEGAHSSTEGGVINVLNGLHPVGTSASDMAPFLASNPYYYSYTYGGNTYSKTARTDSDDSISGISSNGTCSVEGRVALANGATVVTASQQIDVTEKFTVGFGENSLKSWFEGNDDTLAGKTLYITHVISDTTKDGYESTSRYYEYRTAASQSWQRVTITRQNTRTTTISRSGTKITEATTEVPNLANDIYYVKACSVLPNGTVIESGEQCIEVTDKYSVSLGDLSSWYSKFYSTGVDDGTMGGKIAISNLPTTGDGMADYASSVKVYYSGAASGSVTASMNASNTISNITGDGTYNLQAKIVLTGKRDTDGSGTKHTKTIESPSKSVSATREIWTVSMGTATSWWKEANASSTIPGNTISISGGITTNAVSSMISDAGYKIDDTTLVPGISAKTVTTTGGNKSYGIKSYIRIGNYYKYSPAQTLTVTDKFTLTPGAVSSWYKDASIDSTIPGRTIVATKCSTNATSDWYSSLKYEYSGAGSGSVDGSFSGSINIGGSLATGNYSVTAKMTLRNGVVISSSFGSLDVTPVYTSAIGTASTWYSNSTAVTTGSTILVSGGLSISPNETTYVQSCTYSYSGAASGTSAAAIGSNGNISSLASGDYTVSGYITLKNGVNITTNSTTATVTKKPTAIANIKSSYNTNGSVDKKNDAWYTGSGTVGADRLLISVTDVDAGNTDDFTTSKISNVSYYIDGGNVFSSAWSGKSNYGNSYSLGSHQNCYVRITLDSGASVSTTPCVTNVTGLPYRVDTKVADFGWSRSGDFNTYNDKYTAWAVCTEGNQTKTAYALSPQFYIPSNTGINVSIPAYVYGGSLPKNMSGNMYIGASTTYSKVGNATSLSSTGLYPPQASFSTVSRDLTLSSANNAVCVAVECTRKKSWSVYAINAGAYTQYIEIIYR